MNKKKTITKVVILLALCVVVVMAFTSCSGGNLTIDTSMNLDHLSSYNTESETGSTAGGEVESTPVEGGEDESTTVEGGEVESTPNAGEESSSESETGTEAEKYVPTDIEIEENRGILDTILGWIGTALKYINYIMPNRFYIFTLCIFAIIMEILFLPFGIKQHKNSIKQAKLKPKEIAIRRKYAGRNDQATQQKVTQEIQELYQQENYNPLSGCLPLLIQFPVLIVLYWVVMNPMKYVLGCSDKFTSFMYAVLRAEGVADIGDGRGTIQLLNKVIECFKDGTLTTDILGKYCTNPDEVYAKLEDIYNFRLNFNIGFLNLNLGDQPSWDFSKAGEVTFWLLLLIPIFTFVVYFFSMRLNRKFSFQPTQSADEKQQACSNTMMDVTMPLMSVFIAFGVPAAIGIYWMFKSVLGVLKQFILSKVMPLPRFTEDDYKAAEKELAGKRPKKIQKSENAGKVRSLHHIDDEDYDEKGNYAPVVKEEENEDKSEETTNDSAMANGTTLKDESDKQEKKFSLRDLFKKNKKDDK